MILITGATAQVGNSSEIVQRLLVAGHAVRALVPSAEAAAASGLPGDVELSIGDHRRPETLLLALRGVDGVYLRVAQSASMPEEEAAIIDAARQCGVRHVVKQSILRAVVESGITFGNWHRAGEQRLQASGMAWTHLRACSYMSHTFEWLETLSSQGKIISSLGEARYALVHPSDVAEAASAVLTTAGHEAKAYDLTGPQAMSNSDQAKIIGETIGRPVEHEVVSDEALRARYGAMGIAAPLVDALLEYMALVRSGRAAVVSDDVRRITGKAPRSYADWCQENAALLKSGTNPYAPAQRPAYVIGSFVVHDPAGFAPYTAGVGPTLRPFGGEPIVADGSAEILEGQPGPVTIVLRFPDRQAARAWYHSATYQALAPIRHHHSTGTLVIADHFSFPGGGAR